MKNFKLYRNLLLIAGLCSFLSFILNLASIKSTLLLALNGIMGILLFIDAYINHKKIIKNNKD